MNTVLTLLNPQEAARHYASGAWRKDAAATARRRAAAGPRAARCSLAPHLAGIARLGRCARASAAPGRRAPRRARGRVAALARRRRGDAARLRAQRLRVHPLAAPELHRGGDRAAPRAHARRGAGDAGGLRRGWRAGAARHEGGIRCARRGIPGCRCAVRSAGARRPGQDHLSRLHFGHHGGAQGRDAFGQHATRQRPRHGGRLETRSFDGAAQPLAHEPPHRHRGRRADDGRGIRAGGERSARRHATARLGPRVRRHLHHGRAHARHRHPRRGQAPRAGEARQGAPVLHGGRADPARGGADVPRHGHHAAEHLRHDRTSTPCPRTTRRPSSRPAAAPATATRRASSARRTPTSRCPRAPWARSARAAHC